MGTKKENLLKKNSSGAEPKGRKERQRIINGCEITGIVTEGPL